MMLQYHGYLSYIVSVPGLLVSHGEHELCSPYPTRTRFSIISNPKWIRTRQNRKEEQSPRQLVPCGGSHLLCGIQQVKFSKTK
jgi:hypothetical protein